MLEDQPDILCHGFTPTDRPTLPPMTMTMTASDGAGVNGANDDDNATMAATTTHWRTKE